MISFQSRDTKHELFKQNMGAATTKTQHQGQGTTTFQTSEA
jgi:hypothetical protein